MAGIPAHNQWPRVRRLTTALALYAALFPLHSLAQFDRGSMQQKRIQNCTASCLTDMKVRYKDHEAYCRYVCWCSAEPKRHLPAMEAMNACISEYRDPSAPNPLSKEEVVKAGSTYAAATAKDDMMKVRDHARATKLNEAAVLECQYTGTGVRFWYQTVPVTNTQLKAVSLLHPLLHLGDRPMSACPKTYAEAEQVLKAHGRTAKY